MKRTTVVAALLAAACSRGEPLQAQAPRADAVSESEAEPARAAGATLVSERSQTNTPVIPPAIPLANPAASPPAHGAAPPAAGTPVRTPDVVFVPTPQPIVDKMLELADVKRGDVLYDLGCGDGRIVVTAAKRYGVRAFGFDIDPTRVQEAQTNVEDSGVEDLVTIQQRDIFTLDLRPASVVTLYLLPDLNVKLIPQLEELEPGARVVSHDFDMEGVKPVVHLALKPPGEERAHDIYLWRSPIRRSGPR